MSDCDDRINPYFNNIREKEHYLPSDLSESHTLLLKQIQELAASQLNTQKELQTLITAIMPKEKPLEEIEEKKEKNPYFRFYTG